MKPNAVVLSRRTTGAVFTRPEVVAYMMRETRRAGGFRKWSGLRVLEPSCGDGAFVLPLVDALVAESPDWNDSSLNDFLCAFDAICAGGNESLPCGRAVRDRGSARKRNGRGKGKRRCGRTAAVPQAIAGGPALSGASGEIKCHFAKKRFVGK